jgi:hypothetical protein
VPGVTLETLWLLGNAALASMLAVLTLKR